MAENNVSEMIRSSLEGIRTVADSGTVLGEPINTNNGTVIIPVSKVTVGFASGGVDLEGKREKDRKSFGGGGGTSVTVTPIAFLTVDKNGLVNLLSVDGEKSGAEKIASVIERAPEIIDKIKRAIN